MPFRRSFSSNSFTKSWGWSRRICLFLCDLCPYLFVQFGNKHTSLRSFSWTVRICNSSENCVSKALLHPGIEHLCFLCFSLTCCFKSSSFWNLLLHLLQESLLKLRFEGITPCTRCVRRRCLIFLILAACWNKDPIASCVIGVRVSWDTMTESFRSCVVFVCALFGEFLSCVGTVRDGSLQWGFAWEWGTGYRSCVTWLSLLSVPYCTGEVEAGWENIWSIPGSRLAAMLTKDGIGGIDGWSTDGRGSDGLEKFFGGLCSWSMTSKRWRYTTQGR